MFHVSGDLLCCFFLELLSHLSSLLLRTWRKINLLWEVIPDQHPGLILMPVLGEPPLSNPALLLLPFSEDPLPSFAFQKEVFSGGTGTQAEGGKEIRQGSGVVHNPRPRRPSEPFVRWREKGVTTTRAARVKCVKVPCTWKLTFKNAFVSFSLLQCSYPLGRGGSL